MAKNDTGFQNAKGSKNFNAFSNMDMSSLWDMNKAMDAHRKNMETMKQAQGMFSEIFKEVSKLQTKVVQQNLETVKASMKTLTEKSKDNHFVQDQLNQFKQQQHELTEKMKMSTGKVLEEWNAKLEDIKDYHAKMMAQLNEQKQNQAEVLKKNLEEVKAHQHAITETWKNSTQKIMDLMQSTANSHMNHR
jgi:hypothetical protein